MPNTKIKHCDTSPNWEEMDISQAQDLANQGYIVVAGWHSQSKTKSGHIALVVPGEARKSGKWGIKVPMTMDTGEGVRQSSDMLTYGFGEAKQEGIKFYIYKGPINKQ